MFKRTSAALACALALYPRLALANEERTSPEVFIKFDANIIVLDGPDGGRLYYREPVASVRWLPSRSIFVVSNIEGTREISPLEFDSLQHIFQTYPAVLYYFEYKWGRSLERYYWNCGKDVSCFLKESAKSQKITFSEDEISRLLSDVKMGVSVVSSSTIVMSAQSSEFFDMSLGAGAYDKDRYEWPAPPGRCGGAEVTQPGFVKCSIGLAKSLFVAAAHEGRLHIIALAGITRGLIETSPAMRREYRSVASSPVMATFNEITDALLAGRDPIRDVHASLGGIATAVGYAARWVASRLGYKEAAAWIGIVQRSLSMPEAARQSAGLPAWYSNSPYRDVPASGLRTSIDRYKKAIEFLNTQPMTESVWASIQLMEDIVAEMERVIEYRESVGLRGSSARWRDHSREGGAIGTYEFPETGANSEGSDREPPQVDDRSSMDGEPPDYDDDYGSGGSEYDNDQSQQEPPDAVPPESEPEEGPSIPDRT